MNIKRSLFFLLSFCVLFIFFQRNIVIAQNPEPPAGQEWKCLKQESVMGTYDGPDPNVTQTDNFVWYVWTKVTGTDLPSHFTIVTCTQATTGLECTTGDGAIDASLPVPNKSTTPGILAVLNGPTRDNTDTLEAYIRWNFRDTSHPEYQKYLHVEKKVFAVYPIVANSTGKGNEASLHQASLNMLTDSIKKCVSLGWDPEGRVFDAKSLEPIPDVSIKVLDSNKQFVNQITVDNPTITKRNGQYAFYVAEGDYYLEIVAPVGYAFTDVLSTIHPNYSFAYENIYKQDELISERIDTHQEKTSGILIPEHRDIALMPIGSTPPLRRPLEILSHGEFRQEGQSIYMGSTSHPLTTLTFKQGTTEIKTGAADKNGKYEIGISDSLLLPNLPIQIEYVKVDLTTLTKDKTEGSTKTMEFEPIVPYLEGYAYGADGKLLPNSEVSVITSQSNVVVHTTQVDNDGFFSIGSQYISLFPYYLRFYDPVKNVSFDMTTSHFSQLNNTYLKSKNISLMEEKIISDNRAIKSTKNSSPSAENALNGSGNRRSKNYSLNNKNTPSTTIQNTISSANPLQLQVLVVVISIIVLLGLGGAALFYIISKKKEPTF